MTRFGIHLLVTALLVLPLPSPSVGADTFLTMSTTTSTQASGLLDALLPEFENEAGIKIKVIAKGTGAAIRDGMDGNVDIIFVHARKREEQFVSRGFGTKRYAVMHNDFVILGPAEDPAYIRGLSDPFSALNRIAASRSLFVSRGDESGTHTREQELWRASNVALSEVRKTVVKGGVERTVVHVRPADPGGWYLSIGQGMGKALTFADEKRAYILADRGTYIKYRYGRDIPLGLDVLVEGGDALLNPYGIIPVSPEKHPQVKSVLAEKFADWLVSSRGQSLINGYRLHGRQLFHGDAAAVDGGPLQP